MEHTADYVRSRLAYDPDTGILLFKPKLTEDRSFGSGAHRMTTWNSRWAWQPAGSISEGYIRVRLDWRSYGAHRLIWLMVTGRWPVAQIDHIDGNGLSNIWANLREATIFQNIHNAGRRQNNTSGYRGVYKNHRQWAAKIRMGGRDVYLGGYATPQEASAAYEAAARQAHGEFYRPPVLS